MAGVNIWTGIGPEGGDIRCLAVDPQNSQTVYAGTEGGGVFSITFPSSVADLNGDGGTDLVWRYQPGGDNMVWFLNGANVASVAGIPKRADLNWTVGAVGDLNNDGKADLLWRNVTTGENQVWMMNGATRLSAVWLDALPNTGWQMDGCADFNGDGKPEIIWRNNVNGSNVAWVMDGVAKGTGSLYLRRLMDLDWKVMN